MHQLVHHSEAEATRGGNGFSGQDDIERGPHSDEPGKTLTSSRRGNDSELHLRQPDDRLGVIGSNAVGTRQRGLEPASKTGAVNRSYDWFGQRFQPVDQFLALADQSLGFVSGF